MINILSNINITLILPHSRLPIMKFDFVRHYDFNSESVHVGTQ